VAGFRSGHWSTRPPSNGNCVFQVRPSTGDSTSAQTWRTLCAICSCLGLATKRSCAHGKQGVPHSLRQAARAPPVCARSPLDWPINKGHGVLFAKSAAGSGRLLGEKYPVPFLGGDRIVQRSRHLSSPLPKRSFNTLSILKGKLMASQRRSKRPGCAALAMGSFKYSR
jgi:hypothetical protein